MKKFFKWLFGLNSESSFDSQARLIQTSIPSVSMKATASAEVDFMSSEFDIGGCIRKLPDLNAPCLGFAARVLTYMKEKNLTPSQVYARGDISRQCYSRIVSSDDSRVNKITAMQFCVGLGLNMIESERLLKSAGYAFSNVLKEDIAFATCIERSLYDMKEVRKRM